MEAPSAPALLTLLLCLAAAGSYGSIITLRQPIAFRESPDSNARWFSKVDETMASYVDFLVVSRRQHGDTVGKLRDAVGCIQKLERELQTQSPLDLCDGLDEMPVLRNTLPRVLKRVAGLAPPAGFSMKSLLHARDHLKWYEFLRKGREDLRSWSVPDEDGNRTRTECEAFAYGLEDRLTRLANFSGRGRPFAAKRTFSGYCPPAPTPGAAPSPSGRDFRQQLQAAATKEARAITPDSKKGEEYANALFPAMDKKVNITCNGTVLTATGYFVSLAHVSEWLCSAEGLTCARDLKEAVIIALDTIFFDADLDLPGTATKLSVVAPRWEVVGRREVVLDGSPGAAVQGPGAPGRPGNPGGPAGAFFGLADVIVNGVNLTVSASGGRGGDGQVGGNGADGQNGADGFVPSVWDLKQYDVCCSLFYTYCYRWMDNFQNGTAGKDGFSGGAGGLGGLPGRVVIHQLEGAPVEVAVRAEAGPPGVDAVGGEGGRGGQQGDQVEAGWWCMRSFENSRKRSHVFASDGKRGAPGANAVGQRAPEPSPDLESHVAVVNKYRSALRAFLGREAVSDPDTRRFLRRLDVGPECSYSSVLGFVEEFVALESEFHELRNPPSFLSYYQSLLKRVDAYAENCTSGLGGERVSALSTVRTACLARVSDMSWDAQTDMVVDIGNYLQVAAKTVDDFRKGVSSRDESRSASFVRSQCEEYERQINKRISKLQEFFQPSLDVAFKEMDSTINQTELAFIEGVNATKAELVVKEDDLPTLKILRSTFVVLGLSVRAASSVSRGLFGLVAGAAVRESMVLAEHVVQRDLSEITMECNHFEAEIYMLKKQVKEMELLLPILREIRECVGEVLAANSTLDVRRLQLTGGIRRLKESLVSLDLRGEHAVGRVIRSSVDLLEDTSTILLGALESIEKWQDQLFLSNFIANATTAKVQTTALQRAMKDMSVVIQAGFLMREYDLAMGSFKLWAFPFAGLYLNVFKMPQYLRLRSNGSLEEVANDVAESLATLSRKYQTEQYRVTDVSRHKILYDALIDDGGAVTPFFEWDQEQYGDVIARLFQGKEVTLNADIFASPVTSDAVKFKEVQLRFSFHGPAELRRDFDAAVSAFAVNMTLVGQSHYRCGDKVYAMSTGAVNLWYTVRRTSGGGQPAQVNDSYKKLRENEPVLSPFATWSVRLAPGNGGDNGADFSAISRFGSHVNLLLIGSYSYVRGSQCADDLSEYYTPYSMMFDLSSNEIRS